MVYNHPSSCGRNVKNQQTKRQGRCNGLSDEYVLLRMDSLHRQIAVRKLAIFYPQIIRPGEVYKNRSDTSGKTSKDICQRMPQDLQNPLSLKSLTIFQFVNRTLSTSLSKSSQQDSLNSQRTSSRIPGVWCLRIYLKVSLRHLFILTILTFIGILQKGTDRDRS